MSHLTKISYPRAFTLIEIMVTVSIIVILAVILLAVGSNVRRNAQVSATHAELQVLAGLIEEFQKNNTKIHYTFYTNSASGLNATATLTPGETTTFVDALLAYPNTKSTLLGLGDRVKINSAGVGSYVVDSFGRPISYIPIGCLGPTGAWTAAQQSQRDYLESSGPDQTSDWVTLTSAVNADDILSYEAAK